MTISRKNDLGTIIIKWLVKKTGEKKKEGKKDFFFRIPRSIFRWSNFAYLVDLERKAG